MPDRTMSRSYRRTWRMPRGTLRRWSKPLPDRVGRVDAEGLPEASPAQRGDDDRMAAAHPIQPAEIEAASGDRGPDLTRDVWTSLGPIQAESAVVAAGRTPGGKLDPELAEKTGTGRRNLGDVVVRHDVLAGGERIGEIDAETARQVVVADPGRAERTGLAGERAVLRSLLERDGDDRIDHVGHGRRGQTEVAIPPTPGHRQHPGLPQLREMRAGGLGRDSRRRGQLARRQGTAVEKRRQHGRPRRVADQRRDLRDDRAG